MKARTICNMFSLFSMYKPKFDFYNVLSNLYVIFNIKAAVHPISNFLEVQRTFTAEFVSCFHYLTLPQAPPSLSLLFSSLSFSSLTPPFSFPSLFLSLGLFLPLLPSLYLPLSLFSCTPHSFLYLSLFLH